MNMTYESNFFINQYEMQSIKNYENTRLQEILKKAKNRNAIDQIKRYFL